MWWRGDVDLDASRAQNWNSFASTNTCVHYWTLNASAYRKQSVSFSLAIIQSLSPSLFSLCWSRDTHLFASRQMVYWLKSGASEQNLHSDTRTHGTHSTKQAEPLTCLSLSLSLFRSLYDLQKLTHLLLCLCDATAVSANVHSVCASLVLLNSQPSNWTHETTDRANLVQAVAHLHMRFCGRKNISSIETIYTRSCDTGINREKERTYIYEERSKKRKESSKARHTKPTHTWKLWLSCGVVTNERKRAKHRKTKTDRKFCISLCLSPEWLPLSMDVYSFCVYVCVCVHIHRKQIRHDTIRKNYNGSEREEEDHEKLVEKCTLYGQRLSSVLRDTERHEHRERDIFARRKHIDRVLFVLLSYVVWMDAKGEKEKPFLCHHHF